MNQAQIIGRLTRDVEVKYTSQSQTAVVENTVAVNRFGKKDEADFIRVKVFGGTAEAMAKYCKKGALVGVSGRIETSSYQDRETGKMTYKTEVIASSVDFLSWDHTTGKNNKNERVTEETSESYEDIDSEFPF